MAVVLELAEAVLSYPITFLIGIVTLCVLLIIWKSFVGGSGNPLSDRAFHRPPAPLVTDGAARDRILKQGFVLNKVPEKLDAIVVGSGIGGLAAANLLSRVGQKVLVLEQHDQAGGCCHTFTDKGFEFDVGIHYVGEMYEGNENHVLLDHMTDGQLVWAELDEDIDLVALGDPANKEWFAFKKGLENWRRYLLNLFPEEHHAINTYLKYCKDIKASMFGFGAAKLLPKWLMRFLVKSGLLGLVCKYFHFARRYSGDVINELTSNEKLRLLFAYSFGDFGVIPQYSSIISQATLVNHFTTGGYYPRGGASEIALHMIPAIERSGGKVLVRATVSQILCDATGRAVGVRVEKSSGDVDIFAPYVISDAGVVNTFTKLLPQPVAEKSALCRLLQKDELRSGAAALSVFVGLRGDTQELGLKACNVWAFTEPDVDKLVKDYLSQSAAEALESDVPMLFAGFPSAKDPTFNDRFPGKSVLTVVTLVNWDWFREWEDTKLNKRGHQYDTLKNHIGQCVWRSVAQMYPQLADKLEFLEVGSPLTNQYYLQAPHGEMYGLDHNIERFADPEILMALRPETDVPGLILTGQDIFMAGFVGAMLGGLFSAGHILRRNTYFDMRSLQSRLKKEKKRQ